MQAGKAHIVERLRKEIYELQGLASPSGEQELYSDLGPINNAFPNQSFPLRAVHEFLAAGPEHKNASRAFISGMLGTMKRNRGVVIWVGRNLQVFPQGFKAFGIDPGKIIFVSLEKEKDVLWAIEESLKCKGLLAVVGELNGLNFDASRRLQLAVEKSHVTGFIINQNTKSINATACISRWQVTPLPGIVHDELPGIGFPRWKVELLKVRNGRTGSWEIEWRAGKFRFHPKTKSIQIAERRKTG